MRQLIDALTIGSVSRNSCASMSPCMCCDRSKKFLINVRAALGSEVGRKGKRRKGISRAVLAHEVISIHCFAWIDNLHSTESHQRNCSCSSPRSFVEREKSLTFGFELQCATPQQFLHLIRLNRLPDPRILPSWFWWWSGQYRLNTFLIGLGDLCRSVFAFQSREKSRHRDCCS